MPRYRYRARTASGELREGHYEASSPDGVAEFLSRGKLLPVEVREEAEVLDVGERLSQLFGPRVKLPDLVLFSRQMYALTKAGIPVNRALTGLRQTMENKRLAAALTELESNLDAGRALSDSLEDQPDIFPNLMTSIVRVGEEAGQLATAFEKVHDYLAFEFENTRRVKGALRYPMIVISASGVAVAVLVGFVIPQFANVFSRMGVDLPWATRIMLAVAEFTQEYWYLAILMVVATVFAFRGAVRTEAGRFIWDGLKFRFPIIGPIVRYSSLARFCRALAISYGSGVSVVTSMRALSEAADNVHLNQAINQMREEIERGEPLSSAAESQPLFTPLVVQMLAVGEETGRIDEMMSEVADFYEQEVGYRVDNLGAAIEPLLLLVLGGIVLIIALAVFLPMWDMATIATSRR